MGIYCCCLGTCCLGQAQTKTLEITSIVFHSISFILLLVCLIMNKWREIYTINLVFFILMFLITICGLVFGILLKLWRDKGIIKTTKKNTGTNITNAAITLAVINYIICIIEEIIIIISFRKVNYPCYSYNYNYYYYYRRMSSDVDCKGEFSDYYTGVIPDGPIIMTYFTLSYLEIVLILKIVIWVILKQRIKLELDGPQAIPNVAVPVGAAYDPYGRAVVVIPQQGGVVVGNQYQYGMPYASPYQYQQNVPPQNQQFPSSNEYQLQEKIA